MNKNEKIIDDLLKSSRSNSSAIELQTSVADRLSLSDPYERDIPAMYRTIKNTNIARDTSIQNSSSMISAIANIDTGRQTVQTDYLFQDIECDYDLDMELEPLLGVFSGNIILKNKMGYDNWYKKTLGVLVNFEILNDDDSPGVSQEDYIDAVCYDTSKKASLSIPIKYEVTEEQYRHSTVKFHFIPYKHIGSDYLYYYDQEKTFTLKEYVGLKHYNNKNIVVSAPGNFASETPFEYIGTSTAVSIPWRLHGYSMDEILYGMFTSNTVVGNVNLPNSVTSIDPFAFYECINLASITIPNSVTYIGDDAFYGTAWYNNQRDGLVYAGKIVYRYKGTAPVGTSITLQYGTLGISAHAFSYQNNLISITIPNSVTYIDGAAFDACNNLASITIPNSVTYIGDAAFRGCWGLTSITVPNSVTNIEDMTFYGCRGLTSITIPNSVTYIGGAAFYNCTNLNDVYYAGTQEQWEAIDISAIGNGSLLEATIHYNWTSQNTNS